ncbi:MAG: glycosyltransferase family 4 protein, partial [Anaerolineales bacterium]|nr:glycosyltransferase family 4 protein [Anaerolineales bacterium]
YARGGIRSYTLCLLQALAHLDAVGDYVVLASRKDDEPPVPGPNFRPVACWTPCHHALERWALSAEAARLKLDLLHSPDFIPPAWGARRTVITIHDLTFLHYPDFLTAESRRYYNGQIEWAVRRADHILADSHATKVDLATMLQVNTDKITVAHLAAGAGFRPLPVDEVAAVLATHGLTPGYVLFVGTLEPRKNVPGLLRAYRLASDRGVTEAPLVLVGGKGWLYQDVFEQTDRLGLREHVRFLHGVGDAALPALYNGAGVLVIPSFYEGFGLTALEAMACGTPVIAAQRASLPEVVGEAGLLVDPDDPQAMADAMARVLNDRVLHSAMRASGLAQAARFTWEQTARTTLAVYRAVLGSA